jgi:phage terminase Nu1 subunit (DNA packaging protein)
MREVAKSEMTDLRRVISQEQFEKEAVQKTANDLRNMVMKAESEKTELCRFIQDEKQKIAGKIKCRYETD